MMQARKRRPTWAGNQGEYKKGQLKDKTGYKVLTTNLCETNLARGCCANGKA